LGEQKVGGVKYLKDKKDARKYLLIDENKLLKNKDY